MGDVRRWSVALLIFCVYLSAGCGGDPETSRLVAGEKVIGVGKDGGRGPLYMTSHDGLRQLELTPGTPMTVVGDEDKPGADWGSRNVLLHVEDGEHKGKAGTLSRGALRPAR